MGDKDEMFSLDFVNSKAVDDHKEMALVEE